MSSLQRPIEKIRAQTLKPTRFDPQSGLDLSKAGSLEELADQAEVVSMIVDCLYQRLLDSAQLRVFFLGVDLARLRLHQSHFMTQLFSGAYQGRLYTLRAVHKRLVSKLGLNENDFDAFVSLAVGLAVDARMPPALVDEFFLRINQLRIWILDMPDTYTPMTREEFLAGLREDQN